MATLGGGMAFQPGISARVSEPPATLHAEPARLSTPDPLQIEPEQEIDAGEPLTRPQNPAHARLAAPFDGIVTAVHRHASNGDGPKGDGQTWTDITLSPTRPAPPTTLPLKPPRRSTNATEWLAALSRLGPWRQPRLGADLSDQFYHAWQHKVEAVVCVGLDAFSPYPVRSSLLESFPEEVAAGTRLLGDVCGASRVELLCADDLVEPRLLRRSCRRANVRYKPADNVYPDADPTLVVYAHGRGGPRRRMVAHGENPAVRGVVLVEPWHAIRIGRWLANETIDLARPYFVGWANPTMPMRVTWAFPGQPLTQLAESLGGGVEELAGRAILGDPMTGRRITAPTDDAGRPLAPVTPDDADLIALLTDPPRPTPSPCIRCGWCIDVCPTRLEPIRLAELAEQQPRHPHLAERLDWCIDCGLCSHVCPSNIPLAQTLHAARTPEDEK